MTPLAYELLHDLTAPNGFRYGRLGRDDPSARIALRRDVEDAHFFELTAVDSLIADIGDKLLQSFERSHRFNKRHAFLPAPVTWMEVNQEGTRFGMILRAPDTNSATADLAVVHKDRRGFWQISSGTDPAGPYYGLPLLPLVGGDTLPQLTSGRASRPHFWAYAALAIVNTPRVVGRRQHMPHRRAEREKLKALGLAGKFPLRAWTEIILAVAPPNDRTGEPSTEAHLSGEKCLHFCRAHIRVRLGVLEYVDAHWRGNPALGIKQSRYRVEHNDE